MQQRDITPRQGQILAMHASGMTLVEVSEQLHYSYITVRKDMEEAKRRLCASTLAEAVVAAWRRGHLKVEQSIVLSLVEARD
jgi:DNA-binding NarL/FixJ family response regulator